VARACRGAGRVWEQLIVGFLAGRTRIVVTHYAEHAADPAVAQVGLSVPWRIDGRLQRIAPLACS
jgi:hypothetical protein